MIAQVMIYPDILITKTPYDPDFVSNLKRFIPPKQRKWNPIEKVWLFDPKLKDFVIKILMEHYGKVLVFESGKQEVLERKTSKVEEEIQEILEKEGF